MPQTQFNLASSIPAQLESELRSLEMVSGAGLSVYGDGAGGSVVLYARELDNNELQEVNEVLAAHVGADPLVNYLELVAAVASGLPMMQAVGPGESISLVIKSKGIAGVVLQGTLVSLSNRLGLTGATFTLVDDCHAFVFDAGAIGGDSPKIGVSSSDANIDLNLAPKGTGRVQADGVTIPTISSTDTLTNKSIVATQLTTSVVTQTGATLNLTATQGESVVLCDCTSNAITVNLPTAVGNTAKFTIQKTDGTANAVTIDGSGSQTINGSLTAVLRVPDVSVDLVSNNANWRVV